MFDTDNNREQWPLCTRQSSTLCEGEVNPQRWALGFFWCLNCADGQRRFCSIPMHKSNSVLITDKEQLKYVGVQTPREPE